MIALCVEELGISKPDRDFSNMDSRKRMSSGAGPEEDEKGGLVQEELRPFKAAWAS
ncbi:MAG: hypothetical protein ABIM88_02290 [candidate division WOR-3 bacterium]